MCAVGSCKWLVLTCVAVAIRLWAVPTYVALAVAGGWFPRVWQWQLDVVGAHICVVSSWMWLVSSCGG